MTEGSGLRSHLSIFDLRSGEVRRLASFDGRIEAPNWAADALIVNSEGRLYEVPFDAPRLVPIDTGFAVRINNDHGLSPDGRWLAITDKTEHGHATIYVLPRRGGTPRQVTCAGAAYFHGWSPCGRGIAFAAPRGHGFQVHLIDTDGSEETCLTQGFAHCDGPDFSHDGAHVWFNGETGEGTHLWRVPTRGGPPERMSGGTRPAWFPHPAPDGRAVLFLSYPEGTQGHPADLPVDLCLLDPASGRAQTLCTITGGQGSINVPCWAPDGRKFAFVAYERETRNGS